MEYTKLPGLDQNVSRIGLGTWVTGGWMWGGSDEHEAIAAIEAAVDIGINLIDTAPVYGFGRSEEIVGKALDRIGQRDKLIVATKVGLQWNEKEQVSRNSSRQRILKEVDDSLRRLGTDCIDLYQVHWPDLRTPIEETAETLQQLRHAGKVRAVGVSNYSPEQMEAWRKVAPLHTDQPPYNLFERAIEQDVLPYCGEHNIGVLAYGALCRGLLTGKFSEQSTFSKGDLRRNDPKFQPGIFPQYLSAVDRLQAMARRHNKSGAQLAARWVLQQPGVNIGLWGARRPGQIREAAGVAGWSLSGGELAEIERILGETIKDAVGPEFMAPPEY